MAGCYGVRDLHAGAVTERASERPRKTGRDSVRGYWGGLGSDRRCVFSSEKHEDSWRWGRVCEKERERENYRWIREKRDGMRVHVHDTRMDGGPVASRASSRLFSFSFEIARVWVGVIECELGWEQLGLYSRRAAHALDARRRQGGGGWRPRFFARVRVREGRDCRYFVSVVISWGRLKARKKTLDRFERLTMNDIAWLDHRWIIEMFTIELLQLYWNYYNFLHFYGYT